MAALILAGMKVPSVVAQAPVPSVPVVHPVFPAGSESALGAQIMALLADPAVTRAHWGIAVTALDGTPIWGHDAGQFFRPASNAKLYTSGAALAMLGAEKRFTTSVVARGKLSRGTLHGDLELRGGGDANFAGGYELPYVAPALRPKNPPPPTPLADFDVLATQVAAKGITKIEGDIVGNDSYFENTPYPEGWSTDDLLWGYGAPVSALTVHDNQLDLTITDPSVPGKSAEKPVIALLPDVPFYTVNEPEPGQEAFSVRIQDFKLQAFDKNQVFIEREPNSRNFVMGGYVAAKHGEEKDELAIDRPAEFAAAALQQALKKHGITVTGGVRARHWNSEFAGSFYAASHEPVFFARFPYSFTPGTVRCEAQLAYNGPVPEEQVVAEKVSAKFADDLKLTLKDSQNLHAEIMLRNIAAEKDCEHTLRKSLAIMRAYWIHAGLDGDDFQFYDGSGLSTKDLVTPRTTAQLLAYAATQPWFPVWKDALPVGGVDGSLRSRFADAPLKNHVFAKTGTLGESRALSGYVDAASGRRVIFSIMVDDHAPGSADRPIMDKIVAAIAASE
jgi:D-alanyl-D-alanine carboxypeptidase/D-alanyl-D-alanine-endopeptidase (penicillin-binding protein 4)